MMNDLKFALRQLLKNPGLTAVAVLTLALGIGANTAIFSVVNAVLFRPLPFREPGRLIWIANAGEGGMSAVTTTVANFKDWRTLNQSFEALAAYNPFFEYAGYNLTGTGEPERLRGVGVSQNLLDVLGIQPMLGRNFADEECFRPQQAVAWRLEINQPFATDFARNAYYQQLVQRIERVPGVESAGLTDTLPLGRNRQWSVRAKGETYAQGQSPTAFPRIIDSGYIKAMGIPLHAGRDFTTFDAGESEKVLLVNETMARLLWPGKVAVGQVALNGGQEFRVVGVVGNVGGERFRWLV